MRSSRLAPSERLVLLWICDASLIVDFDDWLMRMASFSKLRKRQALEVAADLAERGYISVDGRYLEVTYQ